MNAATSNPPASSLTDSCDEMLTKKELAAKLKVTERCIENWQRRGYLPYLKIASVVLFVWADVQAYLKANFQVCRLAPPPGPLADAPRLKAETVKNAMGGRR